MAMIAGQMSWRESFVLIIDFFLDIAENRLITWRPNASREATS